MAAITETDRTTAAPHFADLLRDALAQPGTINKAHAAFHNYSFGNQLLALAQCEARGIAPGPLATFPGWKDKGRYVRKGEKALILCMPITCKRRGTDTATDDTGEQQPETFTRFVYKPRWFVLSQTDGTAYQPEPLPAWDKARALAALDITEEPFTHTDGNTFGYARQRTIAISPLCPRPWRTTFHELPRRTRPHRPGPAARRP
jgi:hypothetical protein